MAGHNKWSKIKRKKEVSDTKKGKVFSKLTKAIEVAAKKGSDPETNHELRSIIEEARSINMPNLNIEKAIKKGSGEEKEASNVEEAWYGAYGPGGVAVLIKTFTDNKNRTVSEIKHALSKNLSNLTETDSVRWQFKDDGSPKFPIELSEKDNNNLHKLILVLKEQEDVQEIFTNQKPLANNK